MTEKSRKKDGQINKRLVELTRWFFRIIDECNDTTDSDIRVITPCLVNILKEFDNLLCGYTFNTDSSSNLKSMTAVDARCFYVAFKRFRQDGPDKRRETLTLLNGSCDINAFPGQFEAIADAATKGQYGPSALMALCRKRPQLTKRRAESEAEATVH